VTLAYYNEIDPYAAAWLRNLINAGHIAYGDVDERDIRDVRPSELSGYTQCHFFAGLGGWGHALRLARWPDERPVWTGSCPCQPFSTAGKRQGTADKRHLWPDWFKLIDQCRPPRIFGEQVASADGRDWFSGVRTDLESVAYAAGGADLCAAGIGAPHRRQRLYFVAALPDPYSVRPQREWEFAGRAWPEQQFTGLVQDQLSVSLPSGKSGGLVDGVSARVGKLRAFGNAIHPYLGASFVVAAEQAIEAARGAEW
jgi:DNA (cytosine-5)-methyltransferase 1